MPKRTEHFAWLVYDAMSEPDGLFSPAFKKMLKAQQETERALVQMTKAFEAEFLKHHTEGRGKAATVSPMCASAKRVFPIFKTR